MYIVMCTQKVRGSDEYVTAEATGTKHKFYQDAIDEKNELLKLNPYYIGNIYIEEV